MPANTRIQLRRGTSSEWTSQVLYAGEVGYETDTGRFKIGDGTTAWNSLDYAAVVPTGFIAGSGLSVNVAADGSTVTYSLSDPTIQASDITDFVDAVNDRVADLITAGSNIQLTYTDNNNDTSSLQIAVTGVSLSGHTHNLSAITDVTASATEVNYLDGSVPGTGVAGKAVVLDSNLSIINLGNVSTTGTLTIGGDLIVNGSTTTVNSTVTTLDDPILTLGGDTAPVGDDNKDRGVEFRYFSGSAKVGFFGYDDSTGKFTFIPDATNTSEVFSGTTGEIDAKIDWTNINNKPDPVVAVDLTGDVTGSGNLTMTDLGGGTISITTTVAANSVALGTDTTGNYVASIANGNYITGGGTGSEGATLTLAVDATSANTASKVVARDSSGNFSAGIITADLSGTATNATNIEVDVSSANTNHIVFVNGSDGNLKPSVNSNLRFDAANNELLGDDATTPTTKLKYFVIDGGTP